jgi:hypothetical protein
LQLLLLSQLLAGGVEVRTHESPKEALLNTGLAGGFGTGVLRLA